MFGPRTGSIRIVGTSRLYPGSPGVGAFLCLGFNGAYQERPQDRRSFCLNGLAWGLVLKSKIGPYSVLQGPF